MLNRLRRSALYEGWRSIREHQQVARISHLVNGAPCSAAGSDAEAACAVQPLTSQRRRLSASPNVVVFGANDWEQWGLWPAFQRLGRFSLFDFRAAAHHAQESNPGLRVALGRSFLAQVDAVERKDGPVELVFIYTAGAWVDPAMLAELARRGIWTVAMSLDDKQQLPAGRSGDFEAAQLELARKVDVYWTTWRYGADWSCERPRPRPRRRSGERSPRDVARTSILWLGRACGPRSVSRAGCAHAASTMRDQDGPRPVPFDEMIELIARPGRPPAWAVSARPTASNISKGVTSKCRCAARCT
jgi:hypothetical protein